MSLIHISIFVVFVTYVSGKQCDKLGILIYEDLGCTPEYANGNDCPFKYTCRGIEASRGKCNFRGKTYTSGELVDDSLTSPSCDIGCFCSPHGDSSSFTCAILDCPEWLGAPIRPGCYRKYSLDECCSEGQVCPPFNSTEKCTVEGIEYREGEKFYPSNTCLKCICQRGFKGKFEEPFCRRSLCGQQLRRSGKKIMASCAPFYDKKDNEVLCCPSDWICPSGSETLKGNSKSEETCKFGGTTVKVGQYFEKSNFRDGYGRSFQKIKCECVIPPFMKCITVDV